MQQVTVAVDCDGTLVDFFTGKPRYEIIQLFLLFQKRGCRMYIWSHQGIEHATQVRERLGLKAEVIEKYSIHPMIAIDDEDRGIAQVVIPA